MASVVRQIGVAAVLAAAAAGGWFFWTANSGGAEEDAGRPRPAPGVVVATAAVDRLERVVSAVGAGRPVRSVQLAPSSGGRVTEVGFDGGELVRKGDVLLRLDDTEEQATLLEARAQLQRSRSAFERQQTLKKQGRVTESTFEIADADLSVAAAQVERAQKALDDRTLVAPFDGVAEFRTTDIGGLVMANAPVGALDDISALNVDFSVPERFYGEVGLGAKVRATTEIFPGESFDGELIGVGRSIDTVSRSFTARARIANDSLRLPADVFMRVTLVLESREGVIVPEEAISAEGGARFVYVVADGKAERREVSVGIRRAGAAEIAEGLAAGEAVITRGLQKARDGGPVRVIEDPAATPGA